MAEYRINLPQIWINFGMLAPGMHYGRESELISTGWNNRHIRNVIG